MKIRGTGDPRNDDQGGYQRRKDDAELPGDSPSGRWERGVEHQTPLLVRCRSTLTPTPLSTRKWLRLDRHRWDTTQSLPASGEERQAVPFYRLVAVWE